MIDNTDHCPTFLKLPIAGDNNRKIKLHFRIHNSECMNRFKTEIPSRLSNINYDDDVNVTTLKMIRDVNSVYVKCFPVRIKLVTEKRLCKPWITTGIINSIKTKSRYFKLYKLSIKDEHLNRKHRNLLNSIIRLAKRKY